MKTLLEELDIGYCMPLQPVSYHPSSVSIAASGSRALDSLGNAGYIGGERVRGQAPASTMTAQYGAY